MFFLLLILKYFLEIYLFFKKCFLKFLRKPQFHIAALRSAKMFKLPPSASYTKQLHVYGELLKRECCYEEIRVSKSTLDATFCAVNPKFIAVIVDSMGGGAFVVLPLEHVGRISVNYPYVAGHQAEVLCVAWCIHDDNLIASASEDATVKVWHIPDGGLKQTLFKPLVDLRHHKRRVSLLQWHPIAKHVLLSAGIDQRIIIADVFNGHILVEFSPHPNALYSVCFNAAGSKLLTTCRDCKLRVFDARTGCLEQEAPAHESSKVSRAIFLQDGRILTTGFNRTSERIIDLRVPTLLEAPIYSEKLQTCHSALHLFYDADANMVYTCGRGDTNIAYYEIKCGAPFLHKMGVRQLADTQRGICMMPRRGCNIANGEMARLYCLSNAGFCQVVSMHTLSRAESCNSKQQKIFMQSAADWMAGKEAAEEFKPRLASQMQSYTTLSQLKNKSSELICNGSQANEAVGNVKARSKTNPRIYLQKFEKIENVLEQHSKRLHALDGKTNSIVPATPTGRWTQNLDEKIQQLEMLLSEHSARLKKLEEQKKRELRN